MTLVALLAAVSVAFPPEGAKLPYLERCYVMGAADAGEENVAVYRDVSSVRWFGRVTRSGAWATVIAVHPGTNVVEVGGVRRTFIVDSPDTKHQAPGTIRSFPMLRIPRNRIRPGGSRRRSRLSSTRGTAGRARGR